jgi:hypothetical protein
METPPNDQPKYTKLARQIYARLPNSRDYALSDTEAISLGAFAPAWNEENSFASDTGGHEKFGEALRELGEYVPTLFQVRPSDPPPSPQVWRDPVSNEALPNP